MTDPTLKQRLTAQIGAILERHVEPLFKAEVRDFFEQDTSDEEDWPAERKAALWSELDEQVCAAADDSEHHAWVALWEFEHDGFRFQDLERDCKVWTHRFLWCCLALEWGIERYDRHREAQKEMPANGATGCGHNVAAESPKTESQGRSSEREAG